jgi:cobalt/nickel transport system ATP-binding protein
MAHGWPVDVAGAELKDGATGWEGAMVISGRNDLFHLSAKPCDPYSHHAMDVPVLIETQALSFRYADGTQALNGVNFRLEKGETIAVFGPNGSGKTTFLHLLVGLLHGEGTIHIAGRRLEPNTVAYARSQIGLLFQDSNDQLFMPTIAQDVAFGPSNQGVPQQEVERRVQTALDSVGLSDLRERAPHHLSAGQKRRAALAGILAVEPQAILLDEPATFLDPPARADLISTLKGLSQAQVLVTHDVDLARSLAHRAVFFESGRIVAEGSVDDVARQQSWLQQ